MFIVHLEEHGKHNMHVIMHEIGLHYYETEDGDFVFVNTVAGNTEWYRRKPINAAEQARKLYEYLGYPLVKYYKWAIQINQIKDFPVRV